MAASAARQTCTRTPSWRHRPRRPPPIRARSGRCTTCCSSTRTRCGRPICSRTPTDSGSTSRASPRTCRSTCGEPHRPGRGGRGPERRVRHAHVLRQRPPPPRRLRHRHPVARSPRRRRPRQAGGGVALTRLAGCGPSSRSGSARSRSASAGQGRAVRLLRGLPARSAGVRAQAGPGARHRRRRSASRGLQLSGRPRCRRGRALETCAREGPRGSPPGRAQVALPPRAGRRVRTARAV